MTADRAGTDNTVATAAKASAGAPHNASDPAAPGQLDAEAPAEHAAATPGAAAGLSAAVSSKGADDTDVIGVDGGATALPEQAGGRHFDADKILGAE